MIQTTARSRINCVENIRLLEDFLKTLRYRKQEEENIHFLSSEAM